MLYNYNIGKQYLYSKIKSSYIGQESYRITQRAPVGVGDDDAEIYFNIARM